ncbi:MAG: hydrogenase maturation protease [Acidobacteria bacterium]|nr:MAG: hydrogenase maturation protease [Acidobacteriota bacterium]
MDSRSPLLILGLGNLLCSDDGVGVVATQMIAETRNVPEGVQVLDGGTLGLALLPYLEDAAQAILVDAIETDAPPGTLVRLEGNEVGPAVASHLSVHQVGVADLIEAARWRDRIPPTLVLLGIVPATTELRVDLSPAVQAALPALLDSICGEAARLGFPLPPKSRHELSHDAVGSRQ